MKEALTQLLKTLQDKCATEVDDIYADSPDEAVFRSKAVRRIQNIELDVAVQRFLAGPVWALEGQIADLQIELAQECQLRMYYRRCFELALGPPMP